MDADTKALLASLGVTEPICLNCLNEDFEDFVAYGTQVLFCDHCHNYLKKQLTKESAIEEMMKQHDSQPGETNG